MHIDLFVLAAQIINFLVLVFLLKYFLYDRILGAMDAREAKIASQFEEAERLKAQAMNAAQAYDEKNRELSDRAQEMMNQAQKTADHEKDVLMDRVRAEVDQVRQRWFETLNREKEAFLEDLRRRAGSHIYDTIRQVLADLANEDLEERMVDVFTTLLRSLGSDQQLRLHEALRAAGVVVMVRSAFSLRPEQRSKIEDAIREHAGPKVSIRFEMTGSIGAGIEMMAHGYKLSWSIEDYLRSLEEKFVRILREVIPVNEQAL
jgi:F-type H+-transporting ATPase subunit b